jgi:predicted phosphodiesterase
MKNYFLIIIFSLLTGLYAQESTRFMVVSDPHNYSPAANFKETIFYEIVLAAIDEEVNFVFFTGDLVIRSFGEFAPIDSVLKDWRFVLDTLNHHQIKVFACRGNNDVNRESWDSLFTADYSFPQNGPEDEKNITYALEYNNILMISLDQYIQSHRINQGWLDEILTKNSKPHVFVAAHEPAYKLLHTNCMGAYPEERNIFWESLINAGVKIYFCGHDHFYDHALIDDGDSDPNNDVHQVIVGTASHLHSMDTFDGDNGRWTPDSIFHEQANGYVLVEVDDDDVQFTWKHRGVGSNIFEYGGDSYNFIPTSIEDDFVPLKFQLFPNYPNPFNPKTIINYELLIINDVELSVYNLLGQKIITLVSERQEAGYHRVTWDASGFASGIYYYRIKVGDPARRTGEFREVKKMVLLK